MHSAQALTKFGMNMPSTSTTLYQGSQRKMAEGTYNPEYRGSPILRSKDLIRVKGLPKRELPDGVSAAVKWTKLLRKETPQGCDCASRWPNGCIKELRPLQGLALEEYSKNGGILAPIPVGDGKTGVDILLAMLLDPTEIGGILTEPKALLLISPDLKAQLLNKDFPQWSVHFHTPNIAGGVFRPGYPMLHIVAYSELSNKANSDLLARINPKLVIADEAHCLADRNSVRTGRFLDMAEEDPTRHFAFLSGTMTSDSLEDYDHLSALALRHMSPLPLDNQTTKMWAQAVDPLPTVRPAGALNELKEHEGEDIQSAFARRFISTPGVVTTTQNRLKTALYIHERRLKIPPGLGADIQKSFDEWVRPDGELLLEAKDVAEVQRQLACGFYYRRIFPHGEPEPLIREWLALRSAWQKELRQKLKGPRITFMDSPSLLEDAAKKWEAGDRSSLAWESKFYKYWHAIESQVTPEREIIWLSDFMVDDVKKWTEKHTGIIWVEFIEIGERIARGTGLTYYAGGAEASREIIKEKGDKSIIASIWAHNKGKNLQHAFNKLLYTTFPSSATIVEQSLGRVHREYQKADEVHAYIYLHTPEMRKAFATASRRAFYQQTTMKSPKKLCYATIELDSKDVDLYSSSNDSDAVDIRGDDFEDAQAAQQEGDTNA
jgi:hypothetical protein